MRATELAPLLITGFSTQNRERDFTIKGAGWILPDRVCKVDVNNELLLAQYQLQRSQFTDDSHHL